MSGNDTAHPAGTAGDNWNSAHFLDVAGALQARNRLRGFLRYAQSSPSPLPTLTTGCTTPGRPSAAPPFEDPSSRLVLRAFARFGIVGFDRAMHSPGIAAYGSNAFWLRATGNWNCVCNGGLTLGALAILDDDTSGLAAQTLRNTVPNAGENCVNAVASDGTWQETQDYCASILLLLTSCSR